MRLVLHGNLLKEFQEEKYQWRWSALALQGPGRAGVVRQESGNITTVSAGTRIGPSSHILPHSMTWNLKGALIHRLSKRVDCGSCTCMTWWTGGTNMRRWEWIVQWKKKPRGRWRFFGGGMPHSTTTRDYIINRRYDGGDNSTHLGENVAANLTVAVADGHGSYSKECEEGATVEWQMYGMSNLCAKKKAWLLPKAGEEHCLVQEFSPLMLREEYGRKHGRCDSCRNKSKTKIFGFFWGLALGTHFDMSCLFLLLFLLCSLLFLLLGWGVPRHIRWLNALIN